MNEESELISRRILSHHILERWIFIADSSDGRESEVHFFVYDKYPSPSRLTTDVRVMEFIDGKKRVKNDWYTKEGARSVWREKISLGWKVKDAPENWSQSLIQSGSHDYGTIT